MPVWLANLFGSGVIDKILSFIPNPAEKAKAQEQLQSALLQAAIDADRDQRDIDKTEAASPHWFVAAARPAVMWLCFIVLALKWAVYPLAGWVLAILAVSVPPFPQLSDNDAQTLLYALLGLGGLRTLDKISGNDTTQIAWTGIKKAIGR
ncbi:MAG TPA: 3TM-type holin [Bradyrhizobium sp.]